VHFLNQKSNQKPVGLAAAPDERTLNTELSSNSRRLLRGRVIGNGEHHVLMALAAVLLISIVSSAVMLNHLYPHTMPPGSNRLTASSILGGINVEPSMRPWHYAGANPQSWWCVMPNCTSDFDVGGAGPISTIDEEIGDAETLGATMIRLEFPWPVIETSRGVYDWTRADAIMSAAAADHEVILPVLMWTPAWAGGGTDLDVPATSTSDWTNFVTAVMDRYGSQFTDGVDVWNEPDSGNYLYNGSASTYVTDILNPAYTAIKAVNSNTKVIEAGSANDAGSCCSFISSVISDGGEFDIASFHNYDGTWSSEASSYRTILNNAGRSSTPIWMTEFGVESGSGNQSTTIQQVFGGSEPLQAAFWYNLRDTGAWDCCAPTEVDTATWGLLNSDFSQKASFGVMQGYLAGQSTSPPSVPTGLTSPSQTTTSISLSWTASTAGTNPVSGYDVFRNGIEVGTSSTTNYADTGLAANTSYSYTVSAHDSSGNTSAESSASSFSTLATSVTPPSVPTGLTSPSQTTSSISLSWTASSAGTNPVSGYNIYRNGSQVGTSSTTSYTDGSLSASTSYSYTISAYDGSGNTSAQSSSSSFTTLANTPTPPSVPTGLTSPSQTSSSISLSWTASSAGTNPVSGYNIYRNGTKVGTSSTTSYTDGSLSASTSYSYTLSAYDGSGNTSAQSSSSSFSTLASSPTAPSVPTGLTSPSQTDSSINLSWTASTGGSGGTSYNIYRNGTKVGTSTSPSYTDTSLSANTSYSYTISAYGNNNATSAQSSASSFKTYLVADINGDGVVNVFDLSILLSHWGATSASYAQGDLNGDGVINVFDLSILLSHWGT